MRFSSRVLVLCALAGTCASAIGAQQQVSRPTEKLHPQMTRLLEERGPSKGWVYFQDKGIQDEADLRLALQRAETDLTPRAIERRRMRRALPGLVDTRDVPVYAPYVDQVLSTGATLSIESSWLNAISVHGTADQFRAIAELPFVDRIEPVRRGVVIDAFMPDPTREKSVRRAGPGGAQAMTVDPFYGLSGPQLQQVDLIKVHKRGYTGSGVVIGILDTGFHRTHEAFNQPGHVVNVLAEYDFVNGDPNTDIEAGDPSSQHMHGTYILGVIGAYLPDELVGGAYDASFILAKTEDTTNEYMQEEDFYVAGLQFIENNGGDLATSSLGYIDWYTQNDLDGLTAVTTMAVNIATANGMPCCTAAGNSGHDANPSTSALIAPADALQVISCGAVDEFGQIASFSSDGPTADGRTKPELCARGVSTWTVCTMTDTNCTTPVSGTSLSTPILASVVGCLIGAHPTWSVDELRNRLFMTGDYFRQNGSYDPDFVFGYGVPDAYRAGFLPIDERNGAPTGSVTVQR